jgi:lipid II:glycine glycyltransferase (peptidoglycan interpeptide bridge formation enzyme)
MFDNIVGGLGELALAYLDDHKLVAGTMTFDGSEVTYYASGVYERELFDRPLAHFPLYDAILRSRGRSMKFFDLGAMPSKGAASEKEYNIGFFKRGFATFVEMHLVWRWSPDVR